MTIKYKIISQAQPGIKGGGTYRYYARACNRSRKDLYDLSEILSKRSTLSPGDIAAVIIGLSELIPELLMENNTVELGDLGTFSLHLKSDAAAQPEKADYRLIKGLNIQFRPGTRLKAAIRNPSFRKLQ